MRGCEEMSDFDSRNYLRNERDRLLEIRRATPEAATEALRLIDVWLTTIREALEG